MRRSVQHRVHCGQGEGEGAELVLRGRHLLACDDVIPVEHSVLKGTGVAGRGFKRKHFRVVHVQEERRPALCVHNTAHIGRRGYDDVELEAGHPCASVVHTQHGGGGVLLCAHLCIPQLNVLPVERHAVAGPAVHLGVQCRASGGEEVGGTLGRVFAKGERVAEQA